jgi:hypothetical protein
MKKSKLQRKFINQMRSMGDIPWPARAHRYPPTFANALGAAKETHIGACKRPVAEVQVRSGKLRRKKTAEVPCRGRVFLKRGSLGKRRVYCESCRARERQRKFDLRMKRRLEQRFGIAIQSPAKRGSRLNRLRRSGVR